MDKFLTAITDNGLGYLSLDTINSLYAAAQPDPAKPHGVSSRVHEALLAGQKIQAIKEYRDERRLWGFDCGIREAKDFIEKVVDAYLDTYAACTPAYRH